jgi:hypothetical protein
VHAPARAFLARQQAQGKSRREALRCLKRHLARVVFRILRLIARPHPEVERLPLPNRETEMQPVTSLLFWGTGRLSFLKKA